MCRVVAMYGYGYGDDDGDRRRPRWLVAALVAGGLVLLLALVLAVAARGDDDGEMTTPSSPTGATTADANATTSSASSSGTSPGTQPPATEAPATGGAGGTATSTTRTDPTDTEVASSAGTVGTVGTVVPAGSTAPSSPSGAGRDGTYPTLPDGSAVPIVAIFDVDTITLSGTVPSVAAADRLKTLAIANSKTPATIVDLLTVDPDVPANVAVRVLELTSARFPDGSAEIRPEHAAELDRVATVMNALPNVTVLIVGHADQRGDELTNFALSEERAQAVVSYLAGRGIDPSRLASRAVGEADLVTLADDDAALALNRRTEFVFSGLLLGA